MEPVSPIHWLKTNRVNVFLLKYQLPPPSRRVFPRCYSSVPTSRGRLLTNVALTHLYNSKFHSAWEWESEWVSVWELPQCRRTRDGDANSVFTAEASALSVSPRLAAHGKPVGRRRHEAAVRCHADPEPKKKKKLFSVRSSSGYCWGGGGKGASCCFLRCDCSVKSEVNWWEWKARHCNYTFLTVITSFIFLTVSQK